MHSTLDTTADFPVWRAWVRSVLQTIRVPFAALMLAFLIGTVILAADSINPLMAYSALLKGSLGSVPAFGRTLEKSTPLIFSGLAIAFAFKAGLFNIGAQGQLLFGALAAAVVGFQVKGLPAILHIPLSLLAGAAAAGLYAAIQGALKAHTGAHEVITGIMLNYVAINLTDYLSSGPFKDSAPGNIIARTPLIQSSSHIPSIAAIPLGFVMACLVVVVIWLVIKHTTVGFEILTVGLNPDAARYAGIKVWRVLIATMALSGCLAGLGGAVETQAVVLRFQPGFNEGLGFEGITIALLARTHPLGVIPAAMLVGAMKAGASRMQFDAGVSIEIVDVILTLVLFFVSADIIVRWIIRGRESAAGKLTLRAGWGKQ